MKKQSLTERTLGSFAWMLTGSMASAALQLLVTMILARLLSPADFGLISAALIVIYFSEIFSLLGIGSALIQRKDLDQKHISTGFMTNLILSLLMGGFFFVTAPVIASFYLMPALASVLRVLAFLFILRGFAALSEALIKRAGSFKNLATVNFISYLFGYGVVGVVLAWQGFGVWALVTATLSQAALRSILLFVQMPHPVNLHFDIRAFKELLGFGGGITLSGIANYFARQGDNFVVGRWLGAEALGYYGRAFNLMRLPTAQFSKVVDEVLFPILSGIQEDKIKIATAFQRGVSFIVLLVLPLSALAIVVAPELIATLYGPGWDQTILPFQILCLSMFFRSAYKMSGSISRALGTVFNLAKIQLVYALVVVVGALIAGPIWGIAGVAFTSSIAIALNYLLLARDSNRALDLTWRDFGLVHLPGIFLGGITLFVAFSITSILRPTGTNPVIIIFFTSLATAITFLIVIISFPNLLGIHGQWAVNLLYQGLRKKWIDIRSAGV